MDQPPDGSGRISGLQQRAVVAPPGALDQSGEVAVDPHRDPALEDPLNIPMPFAFEPRQARYLRLTELANEEIYYWSIAELHVIGQEH